MSTRLLRSLPLVSAFLLAASMLPAQTLTIYYTASLRGNLDGCTCERNKVAGLVKRAAYLRALPRSDASLRLDAGDILDATRDPDLSREILAVYRELGYAAVGVGETELSEGARALLAYSRRFPFLAHNLSIRAPSGRWVPLSSKPLLLKRAGVRIAILAVTDPETLRENRELKEGNIRLEDPDQTVRRLAGESRRKGVRLVIVLFHGPDAQVRRLAEQNPDIDLVLFGHQGWIVPPEKAGRALIASPGENGNRIGVLSLRLVASSVEGFEHRMVVFDYAKDPDDPSVRLRVTAYRKKLQARLRAEDKARSQER
jgi:2',3'-cyclic-nucleotide 2'-phosphodiesterase (5'-nucleotidase family)